MTPVFSVSNDIAESNNSIGAIENFVRLSSLRALQDRAEDNVDLTFSETEAGVAVAFNQSDTANSRPIFGEAAKAASLVVNEDSVKLANAQSDLVFVDDFEDGNLKGWAQQEARDSSIRVVESPTRNGDYAVRIELEQDDPDVQGSRRAEMKLDPEPADSERWYGFSIFLPDSHAYDESYEIVAQWHAFPDFDKGEKWDRGGPPLNLFIDEGVWKIHSRWDRDPVTRNGDPGSSGGTKTISLGEYETGVWTDFVFHIDWSYRSDGFMEVWKDSEKLVTRSGPNRYNDEGGPFFKTGIYKPEWKWKPGKSSVDKRVVYFDELRISDENASYADVAPASYEDGGTPPQPPQPPQPDIEFTNLPLDFRGTQVGTQMLTTFNLEALLGGDAELTISAHDIDAYQEAKFYLNGQLVPLPEGLVVPDKNSADTVILDDSLLLEGENTITFEFASDLNGTTSGYRINDLSVTLLEPEPSGQIIAEYGQVNLSHNQKTVFLEHQFQNPVVLMMPPSFNGGESATVRLADVEADRFSAYLQEPSDLDGSHDSETVSYLVIESGSWQLTDGTSLEAGTLQSNRLSTEGWEKIDFNHSFSEAPALFSQVQTRNGADLVVTRQRNASSNNFELTMQEEEALQNSGHAEETLGYLAIDRGSGVWDGNSFVAEQSSFSNEGTLDFAELFSGDAPQLYASISSFKGSDPVWLRYSDLGASSASLKMQEDTTLDREVNHISENVDYLAIGFASARSAIAGSGTLTGVAIAAQAVSVSDFSTYNVLDFGATPNDRTDDTEAIQAALDEAKEQGGGHVYIPSGVFLLSGTGDASDGAIRVHSNTELYGDGMGLSELKIIDGYSEKITGIVRTPVNQVTENVVIRDLTLNGNNTGEIDGIMTGVLPGSSRYDRNILIERVEIHSVTRIAFNPHEQTRNLTIRDSVAHHNAWDGFIADFVSDSVYENNVAYANGRHGFNVVTHSYDMVLRNNKAYDNGESGIVVQRGNGSPDSPDVENYPESVNFNVLIEGNEIYDNGSQGILLKMTDRSQVINNSIYSNQQGGIKLEAGADNIIAENSLTDNSGSGILVKNYSGGITGPRDSHDNLIFDNSILGSGTAIEESHSSTRDNTYAGNIVDGDIDISSSSTLLTNSEGITFNKLTDTREVLPEEIPVYSFGDGGGDSGEDPPIDDGGNDSENPPVDDGGNDSGDPPIDDGGDDSENPPSGDDRSDMEFPYSLDGKAVVEGSSAEDFLSGSEVDEVLFGDRGDDTLKGRQGNDILFGEEGNDYLEGNDGDDILFGGVGSDLLKGGGGRDVYVYTSLSQAGDTIQDFRPDSGEQLDLSGIFDGIANLENEEYFERGYVSVRAMDDDTLVSIDLDGSAGQADPQTLVTLSATRASDLDSDSFIFLQGNGTDSQDSGDSATEIIFVADSVSVGNADRLLVDTLEQKGYLVSIADDDGISATVAEGKDLVLISKSVSSLQVGDTFQGVETPVMVWKPTLYDDLGLTGSLNGEDYGTSANQTAIDIISSNHPASAGMTGTVTTYSAPKKLVWGIPGAEAIAIATVPDNPELATIFAYEAGATLAGGTAAPDRRVGFFLDNTNTMTDNALALFEATVDWVLA